LYADLSLCQSDGAIWMEARSVCAKCRGTGGPHKRTHEEDHFQNHRGCGYRDIFAPDAGLRRDVAELRSGAALRG
jgi:hypothetical protein